MLRTAAGRRALLHVALLVGGLFVLGVLCGERAQATEGVPSPRDVTAQVGEASPERRWEEPAAVPEPVVPQGLRSGQDSPAAQEAEAVVPDPGRRPATEGVIRVVEDSLVRPVSDRVVRPVSDRVVGPVSDRVVRPVSDRVVRPVSDRVVRPVVDVVETVTDGLGTVAQGKVPPLEALTSPSGLTDHSPGLTDRPSGLPAPPDLSDTPTLSDLSGLSGLPGRAAPGDPFPQTLPSTTAPAAADASGASEDPTVSEAAPDARSTGGAAVSTTAATYGPEPVESAARSTAYVATDRAVTASGATTPSPSPAPARQSPAGDPDGALGTGAGADHGTPRHGDAHAVTPHHRIPFRLVPGAVVRAEVAETRDRYRDIPVSPA